MRKLTVAGVVRSLAMAMAASVFFVGSDVAAQDKPRVMAVNYPLQYFAKRVFGDSAEVVFPVPAGVDPSFWRPSIADISQVQGADLILLNGAGFATWVDRVSLPRSRLVNTSRAVSDRFIVTETITHSHGDGGEHSHEGVASYTWLDPTMASAQATAIAAAAAARGIAPAEAIEAGLSALLSDLDALDALVRAALEPAQGVAMIATHPRYQYLAARYGLTIDALEWEAGVAPTAAELSGLSALMAQTGARVLIWEAAPPQAAFDAVAAIGLRNVVFEPMAKTPSAGDYPAAFAAAANALADAAAEAPAD
ncbi:MAG: metal ABC transporter substrate-binding protein [Pseudomonadota bacterium]